MTTASEPTRRSRYQRDRTGSRKALTPHGLIVLETVARFHPITTKQGIRATGFHPKDFQRSARLAFDLSLIDIVPVPRSAIVEPEEDGTYMFGNSPNLYFLSRKGTRLLEEMASTEYRHPQSGPGRSHLFLLHDLGITDFHIYLYLCSRAHPGITLESFLRGRSAEMDLSQKERPRVVRPDFRFCLGLPSATFIGIGEVDRNTEDNIIWKQKLAAYKLLFTGDRLRANTGKQRANLLVITPDTKRRDHLSQLIQSEAPPLLSERVWIAERKALVEPDFLAPVWVRAGSREPEQLISSEHLG